MTGMTRSDHRDADLDDARFFPEKDWERATDEAAKLLFGNVSEFDMHVLTPTGLDMEAEDAMDILQAKMQGFPLPADVDAIAQTILTAYNAAVDRLARRELESK